MSVFLDISAALDGHLSAMIGLPTLLDSDGNNIGAAWDNKEAVPVIGELWLRPTLLPAETVQATLGESGQDMSQGVYQIDVFAPLGEGKNEALAMADKIADHFKRGTDLVYNSRTVRIKNVSQAASVKNEGWFQIPINIVYMTHTEARI